MTSDYKESTIYGASFSKKSPNCPNDQSKREIYIRPQIKCTHLSKSPALKFHLRFHAELKGTEKISIVKVQWWKSATEPRFTILQSTIPLNRPLLTKGRPPWRPLAAIFFLLLPTFRYVVPFDFAFASIENILYIQKNLMNSIDNQPKCIKSWYHTRPCQQITTYAKN